MPDLDLHLPAREPAREELERFVSVLAAKVVDLEAGQEVLAEELRRLDPHFDEPERKQARRSRFRALRSEARSRLTSQRERAQ